MFNDVLNKLVSGQDLSGAEAETAMRVIMAGDATAAQIAAFLVALRMKGETTEEIAAAARVMRSLMTPVDLPTEHLTDIVGTGGDHANTFNVSTAASFVAAAGGARIAKHGNRSVSSKSGSADLLEAAGARLDLGPEAVRASVEQLGIGFMFAPMHHGAMKHAAPVRRELGLRTLFNLLGPLTNPAQAPHQVLGVFDRRWLESLARVLGELGSKHVLVVHALDGLDELSIAAPSQVAELKDGEVRVYSIAPEDFGLTRASIDPMRVSSPAESLAIVQRVLGGEAGAGVGQEAPGDVGHLGATEGGEDEGFVDAVPELGGHGGAGSGAYGLAAVDRRVGALCAGVEADASPRSALGIQPRPEVAGHHDHGVAEVHRTTAPIGEPPLVEQPEQRHEHVPVGLLNLVEQHELIRPAPHGLGELPPVRVADVPRRRAHEPRHGVRLGKLGHVEAGHAPRAREEQLGHRLRRLGLAHPRRPEHQNVLRRDFLA